jgi:hypothetical protein
VQPLSSATTGALAVVTQRSSVGQRPGTTDASKSVSVSDETAREWLLRQASPEAADAALARSLTSTLGVTASPRTEWRYPNDAPAYRITTGCEFEIQDPGNIPAALAKIEQAMTPPTMAQAEGWLVMLQAATAHRADSDVTSAVAYTLYAAELRRYPADVAKGACERLARGKPGHTGTNWFPTLAELVAECERHAAPRRIMFARLQHWSPPKPLPTTARGIPEPSAEEKATVHAMAQDALAQLQDSAKRRQVVAASLPSIAGVPDIGGLTKEMRELMARRQGLGG